MVVESHQGYIIEGFIGENCETDSGYQLVAREVHVGAPSPKMEVDDCRLDTIMQSVIRSRR